MRAACGQSIAAPNLVTVPSLESLKASLLSGADSDRAALAGELRLNIPMWRRWGVTKDIPCTLFDSVQISYATLLQPGTQAVVDIYSRNCEYSYLAGFEHTHEGSWTYIDTVPLWSKHSEPKVSLESLIEEGTKEIIYQVYVDSMVPRRLLECECRRYHNELLQLLGGEQGFRDVFAGSHAEPLVLVHLCTVVGLIYNGKPTHSLIRMLGCINVDVLSPQVGSICNSMNEILQDTYLQPAGVGS